MILNLLLFGGGPALVAAGIMGAFGFNPDNDPGMPVWTGVLLAGCAYALKLYVSAEDQPDTEASVSSTASTPDPESGRLPQ
ncbi:MAG: hypothetical protein AAF206_21745 [Bacteroidota bacterium]